MDSTVELELDGHIYLVEKDKDGKVIHKDEIDGELALKALVHILEESLRNQHTELKDESEA